MAVAKVRGRKTDPEHPAPVPLQFLAGWAAGGAVLAVMLLLSALLASGMGLPLGALEILLLLSIAAGSLAAGWVTARRIGQKGLVCGAASGLMLFLTALGTAVVLQSRLPELSDCGRAAVFITAAMIGGVLGVQKASRRKR